MKQGTSRMDHSANREKIMGIVQPTTRKSTHPVSDQALQLQEMKSMLSKIEAKLAGKLKNWKEHDGNESETTQESQLARLQKFGLRVQLKGKQGKRIRKSRRKPIEARTPLFLEDPNQELQTTDKPTGKRVKYRGKGRPRNTDNYVKMKKIGIPKHRFVGQERLELINYAMKYGSGVAAEHFSNITGVAVYATTVRSIVKQHIKETTGEDVELRTVLPCGRPAKYNKFRPIEKQQIAKYCIKHGPWQTAAYIFQLWGIRVNNSSIKRFVKEYQKSLAGSEGTGNEKEHVKRKDPENVN